MNPKLARGQILIDADGDEIEVVRIRENSVLLRTPDSEIVAANIDDVLQDLESGDLIDPDLE